jgi:hypothetical protein
MRGAMAKTSLIAPIAKFVAETCFSKRSTKIVR